IGNTNDEAHANLSFAPAVLGEFFNRDEHRSSLSLGRRAGQQGRHDHAEYQRAGFHSHSLQRFRIEASSSGIPTASTSPATGRPMTNSRDVAELFELPELFSGSRAPVYTVTSESGL